MTELIANAPWREAVTYRDTWPHEYVLLHGDHVTPGPTTEDDLTYSPVTSNRGHALHRSEGRSLSSLGVVL